MTWQSFKQAWLIRFWSPFPAVIAAGILSTYYFGITGTFWAVTGEFTRWGGQLLQLLGVHSEQWGYYQLIHLEGSPLTRIDGRMIIGMFGGCLAAALAVNNEGVGGAAGVSGIAPGWAALANFLVTLAALPLGRALGDKLAGRLLGKYALPLSGALLVLLGIWEAVG